MLTFESEGCEGRRMDQAFGAFLDDISRCFMQRDLALWRRSIRLPFSFITRSGPVLLRDDAAVARNFEAYLEAMDIMALTLISREAMALEDCGDGTWLGTYRTRLVRDQHLATPPYTATALLHPVDGRFEASSILNARGHHDWTGLHDV